MDQIATEGADVEVDHQIWEAVATINSARSIPVVAVASHVGAHRDDVASLCLARVLAEGVVPGCAAAEAVVLAARPAKRSDVEAVLDWWISRLS